MKIATPAARWTLAVSLSLAAFTSRGQSAGETHPLDQVTPSWLEVGGQIRGRFEAPLGPGLIPGSDSSYLLTRARLNVLVKPTPWLKFYGEAQDTRALGFPGAAPATMRDPFDLRQGYAEISRGEGQGFLIRVGRQDLTLGSGRVISSGDWGNTAKTFDVARTAFYQSGFRAELVAGSVVQVDGARFDRHKPGEHFYASYNTFDKLVPGTKIEPYIIAKTVVGVTGEIGASGDAAIYTGGLRWAGKLPYGMDFSAETFHQWGTWASDSISASAGTYTFGWTVSQSGWKPRISSDYTFGSGDPSPKDGKHGLDVLYGANQPFFNLSGIVGWRNIRNVRVGTDFSLRKNLQVKVDYHHYHLATTADGLYNTSGTRVVLDRNATSSHVGQEFDGQVLWTDARCGQIGFGLGELLAGAYLQQAGKGGQTLYPYMVWAKRF